MFDVFVIILVAIIFFIIGYSFNNKTNNIVDDEKLLKKYGDLLRDYIELDTNMRNKSKSQLIQDDSYFDNEHIQREFESSQTKRNGNIVEYTMLDGSKYHIIDGD